MIDVLQEPMDSVHKDVYHAIVMELEHWTTFAMLRLVVANVDQTLIPELADSASQDFGTSPIVRDVNVMDTLIVVIPRRELV